MKNVALFTTMATGFVLTTFAPAMAYSYDPRSAPAVEIGSGLLGNMAVLAGMSVVLFMSFRRRSRG